MPDRIEIQRVPIGRASTVAALIIIAFMLLGTLFSVAFLVSRDVGHSMENCMSVTNGFLFPVGTALITSMEQTDEPWDWPHNRLPELYSAFGCGETSGFSRVPLESCPPPVQEDIVSTYDRLFGDDRGFSSLDSGPSRLMAFASDSVFRLVWLSRIGNTYWDCMKRDVDAVSGRVLDCDVFDVSLTQ